MDKSAYEVIQIDEKSWRIEEKGVRSFLFAGTDKALLVDTGFGTGNIKEVVDSLTDLPVMLVNTHADRDHIGCNHLFSAAFIHPNDIARYQSAAGKQTEAIPILEGDVIDIGGGRFEVIQIPGHTPGSVALLDADNRILISGDSVQAGLIFMFGPGRDIAAYIESMNALAQMSGRFDKVYPSHGPFPVTPDIIEKLAFGAKSLRAGELTGTEAPFETTAKVYDVGAAKFLYE